MLSTKAQATKQKILKAAAECFLLNGYHATGLETIIKNAKITKGNFYYHFKSKEALAIETLDWQFERISQDIKNEVLSKNKSSLETLFLLLDLMTNRQKAQYKEGAICGCYFGNFSLEMSNESLPVRQKVKEIFKQYAALMESLLDQAIIGKMLSPLIEPKMMSNIILSQLEGAILLDKTNQKPQQVDESILFIKNYLSQSN